VNICDVFGHPFGSNKENSRIRKLFVTDAVINNDVDKRFTPFDFTYLTGHSNPRVSRNGRGIVDVEIGGEYTGSDCNECGRAAHFVD